MKRPASDDHDSLEHGLRQLIAEVVRDELRKQAAPKPAEEYLSLQAAAAVADVAPGTLRRWIREGRIVAHHAGRRVRVLRTDLERLMRDGWHRRRDDSPEALADRAFELIESRRRATT